MIRKILVLMVVAMLVMLVGAAFAKDVSKTAPISKSTILVGDEPFPDRPYYPSYPGLITQSPGDTMGSTQYDYQSNGSSGRRVALDSAHGVHFGWMNGISYPNVRQVWYNYVDVNGVSPWAGTGLQASQSGTAYTLMGYCQAAATSDNRGVLAYHKGTWDSIFVASDAFPGLGSFSYASTKVWFGTKHCLWPYFTIDRGGRIQVVANENASPAGSVEALGYTRSTNNGQTWLTPVLVDTIITISPVVVASPVSDKVAIVYTHPFDITTQWANDIYYIESADGVTWDFAHGKNNVTHYRPFPSDSACAYTDCGAVYDYNDALHIVWNQQFITDSSVYYLTYLQHYTGGTINSITRSDSIFVSSACGANTAPFGAWNWMISKMSIATDPSNNLFVTYTSWDTSDIAADGCANGDIWMLYSSDHGASWTGKTNLTDSHTPNCESGDCDSDHWSSMAEHADNFLHIFYVNDKDAGGIPQTEGSITDNPMMYLKYPNPALTGISDNSPVPTTFTLSQNYPNPFNAETKISFELKKNTNVNLSVYDIKGAKVATILNEDMQAGQHEVDWNANTISSGTYYYTLKADGQESTKKMVLLK